MSEILVKVTRGGHEESFHRGSIAVVDRQGKLLGSVGDPGFSTFLRSCAKPLQVLPLLESGAADRFGFTTAEISCMCGSLNGQDYHVQAVSSILGKIGLSEDHLQCGLHPPSHRRRPVSWRKRERSPASSTTTAPGNMPPCWLCACSSGGPGKITLNRITPFNG